MINQKDGALPETLPLQQATQLRSKRNRLRILGLLLALCGCGSIVFNWYSLFSEGTYYPKNAVLGPFALIVGLATLVLPVVREEPVRRGTDLTEEPVCTGRCWLGPCASSSRPWPVYSTGSLSTC